MSKEKALSKNCGRFSSKNSKLKYLTVLKDKHVSITIIKMIEKIFNILSKLKTMSQLRASRP